VVLLQFNNADVLDKTRGQTGRIRFPRATEPQEKLVNVRICPTFVEVFEAPWVAF